jgi:hypothetical protein
MASKYNPVPSEIINKTLEDAGFEQGVAYKEVVYERPCHRLPSLVIRVYTSASVGKSQVKGCGKDAIRVVLLYKDPKGKTHGVKKAKKVLRTGKTEDILERMLERARYLYAFANWMNEAGPCKCGAPRYYPSKKCVVCSRKKSNGNKKAA